MKSQFNWWLWQSIFISKMVFLTSYGFAKSFTPVNMRFIKRLLGTIKNSNKTVKKEKYLLWLGHPLLHFLLHKGMYNFEGFFVVIYHTKYVKYKPKQLNCSTEHEMATLCFCACMAMGYRWHLKEHYTCQSSSRNYVILQYKEDCPWWFPHKALIFMILFLNVENFYLWS